MVEKGVNTGEIILEPTNPEVPADQTVVVEKIIAIVALESATETIRRMAALHKQACSCVREKSESISGFAERFVCAAHRYLYFANSDRDSAESHNFAMLLIYNARVPPSVFTAVMNNLV